MVTWRDGAITNPSPATSGAVRQAERELRVKFPADFLAVATVRQGAHPEPANITLPNGWGEAVEFLLHFEVDPFFTNIVERIFTLKGVLDKGVIPFATALGSNVLCFNFRKDFHNPTVEFWSVDTGPVPIASSFTDLLTKLHD